MDFSKEEFDIMVEELLYRKPISFTMLSNIVEKTLRRKIKFLCATDKCLKDRGYEDDIMQEIQIKLMKTTVSSFLLKNGLDGPINADPKGFKAWITTVGENLEKDFARKIRIRDFRTENIDNPILEKDLVEQESDEDDKEKIEKLKEAFAIVLSADSNVYIVLTWIAQFIFIINLDVTKKQSNYVIVETFGQKTLFEMYEILLEMSEKITWIDIPPSQHKRIIKELNKPWESDIVYGDVRYEEFFMKVNGEKSGKKSISDWVHRMNSMVRKKSHLNKNTSEEGH